MILKRNYTFDQLKKNSISKSWVFFIAECPYSYCCISLGFFFFLHPVWLGFSLVFLKQFKEKASKVEELPMKQCSPVLIFCSESLLGFCCLFYFNSRFNCAQNSCVLACELQGRSQVSSNLPRFAYYEMEREFQNHASNVLAFPEWWTILFSSSI